MSDTLVSPEATTGRGGAAIRIRRALNSVLQLIGRPLECRCESDRMHPACACCEEESDGPDQG